MENRSPKACAKHAFGKEAWGANALGLWISKRSDGLNEPQIGDVKKCNQATKNVEMKKIQASETDIVEISF